jgi:hypothetical protein
LTNCYHKLYIKIMGHVITITDQDNRKLFSRQIPSGACPRVVEAVKRTLLKQVERLKKVTYVDEVKALRNVDEITSASRRTDLGRICLISDHKS